MRESGGAECPRLLPDAETTTKLLHHKDTLLNPARGLRVIQLKDFSESKVRVNWWPRCELRHKTAALFTLVVSILLGVAYSNQQLLFSVPINGQSVARHYPQQQHRLQLGSPASQEFDSPVPNTQSVSAWRSHTSSNDRHHRHQQNQFSSPARTVEARGALTRNLYSGNSRGARNASLAGGGGGGGSGQNSWHFPRISPEHAAEVLLTGAQVINRIAQAETPLNYCRTPDDQDGECSDIRKCIWLVLDKARLKQSVCLRNLIIPAVCCPLSSANNTPIANMIQSTLEPVLFRPKAPKQKKQPIGSSQMRPFASIVNKTIVGMPHPSPISMVVRQTTSNGTKTTATTTTTTTTTSTTTSSPASEVQPASLSTTTLASTPGQSFDLIKPQAETGAPANEPTKTSSSNTLFQEESPSGGQVGKVNNQYNRTISHRYPWANETCGEGSRTRTGRIVGGSDSKLGQWPWMTAMYLNKRNTFSTSSGSAGEFWCGGALINRRFILTAAHCLSDQRGNRYKNEQVTIKLGGVDLVRHQAPLDILRNLELESRVSANEFALSTANPFAAIEQQHRTSRGLANRRTGAGRGAATQLRSEEEEEEFSWTSFITKALGLTGLMSSSSSSLSSPSSVVSTSGASSDFYSAPSDGFNTKALNSELNRKQQLAGLARKTYFKEYKVANIKQHPKFQRHGFYNDIGLIELKSDVDYDDLISPICLPTEHDLKRDLTGYMATVLGWGTLSYGGQGSKLLQQVSMPVWNNKDCDERYLQHIGKTFMCAGFLTGGKDACQGDSGGPLMVSDNSGRWTLHGVVSFGKTCAQASYPGVYTRVTEYLDWIRDNTDLNGYSMAGSSNGARVQRRT